LTAIADPSEDATVTFAGQDATSLVGAGGGGVVTVNATLTVCDPAASAFTVKLPE
jgi:hypothetical protein